MRELRLERIAAVWQDRCAAKYNKWVDKYNQRIAELEVQEESDGAFAAKFNAWWAQVVEVGRELDALVQKFIAHEDVTPADWDVIAAGKERKVFALIAPDFPKEKWPWCVPYPNLIAWRLYEEAEEDRRTAYMKQYHVAMQELKLRGQTTMELKRVAGDTSPGAGFEMPVALEQLQHWHEVLLAEKQQSETDEAHFYADIYTVILPRLHDQPVLSEDWDATAWANAVLEDIGVVTCDEAKDWIVQSVQTRIEQLRLGDAITTVLMTKIPMRFSTKTSTTRMSCFCLTIISTAGT